MENRERYSVSHPEFKYAESKNIYWGKLKNPPQSMKGLAYTDHDTESHSGEWRSWFKNPFPKEAKLHVEIGCNAGHVTLKWAEKNPNQAYIGIDWKFKQIYRMAEKASQRDLKNVIGFRANADRLPFMFGEGEIDHLYMFFPDPWPKKAQKKNRTLDREWVQMILPLLKPEGRFEIKTDHRDYFDFMLEELRSIEHLIELEELTFNLHEHHPNPKELTIPDVTLFERLFIKDGLPIHRVIVRKKTKS